MISNVKGRVANTPLPKTQGLLPLFEAIINSIDAIDDASIDINDGTINIKILRQDSLRLTAESGTSEQRYRNPIYGFEITDNGIGFSEKNYKAFNEADTRNKETRGGKGVGRFVWLKAFKRVEIDSVFRQDGQLMRRTFVFSLESPDGISNHVVEPIHNSVKEITIVRLLRFDERYEKTTPRNANTIAQHIVEHCLEYFVMTRMPLVNLYDEDDERISLEDTYDQLVANTIRDSLKIQGINFEIVHFMLHAHSDLKHQLCYCANGRVVLPEKLGNKIPNLPSVLADPIGGVSYVYAAYISSVFLDKRVNQQRIGFDTIPENGLEFDDELSWSDIEMAVLNSSRKILQPYTEAIRAKKEERIKKYVNNQAPQFRHIIKNHAEKLDSISPEITDDKLEIQLYDINRQIELELRKKAEDILNQENILDCDEKLYEGQIIQFEQWWQEYNEVGKSSLAKYITHRKVILNILEKALCLQDTGKYSREELIHKLIFPLKKSSDDITYDQHNLWVLDEKLSYHQYLASDLSLKQNENLDSESLSRPDLFIFFDRAIAVVDDDQPYNSGIVIFEFKRPMRNDYTGDDNPIQQVLQYVQEVRDGKALSKDGRPIRIPTMTPFYCYIVCDLTPNLQNQAKYAGLRTTPDNLGFFGYNDAIGAYIEVIGFDKLLLDAKKRNRILFEKLNLPENIGLFREKTKEVV